MFLRLLGIFWDVFVCYGTFWYLIGRFWMFRGILLHFSKVLYVLVYFGIFDENSFFGKNKSFCENMFLGKKVFFGKNPVFW